MLAEAALFNYVITVSFPCGEWKVKFVIFHHIPAGAFRTWCKFNFSDEVVNSVAGTSDSSETLHRPAVGLSPC